MKIIKYNPLIVLFFLISHMANGQCFEDGHSTFQNQGWLSCETSESILSDYGAQHWVMYDFGEPYTIDSIYYWNHNVWGETGMGAKEIMIDYSLDQENWTSVGPITLEKAPGSWKYTGNHGPSLLNANMRYMLITVLSTHDEIASCAGIAEFRFGIGEPVDTEEIALNAKWSIGPNPATESINLMVDTYDDIKSVAIYNSVGQLMMNVQRPRANQTVIPISALMDGIYFMSVYGKDGVSTRSFVKG